MKENMDRIHAKGEKSKKDEAQKIQIERTFYVRVLWYRSER